MKYLPELLFEEMAGYTNIYQNSPSLGFDKKRCDALEIEKK